MHAHRVVLILGWSLMLGCNTCMAQSRSLSFWEPKAETVAALKRAANEPDQRRYQTLRQAFVERGCTAEHMTEESFSRRGERNLVCILPGCSSDVVMIEARYDKDAFAEEGADWQDAITLPLLFGALQAQPREHTFLFAAIGGHDAEQQFLKKARRCVVQSPCNHCAQRSGFRLSVLLFQEAGSPAREQRSLFECCGNGGCNASAWRTSAG